MADRVIRDELLTSERYWSVSIEAQRLFIHLLLSADDTARFSGKNYTIRSTCFPDPDHSVTSEALEKLITELHDADLIRLYTASDERFIFIPRFKQRLRFTKSKYPAPPSEINDMPEEKSDQSQAIGRPESDSSPQKRSEVKRSEVKRIPPKSPQGGTSGGESSNPQSKWCDSEGGIEAKGKELGIDARPGETWAQYKRRLQTALAGRQEA
jgi:hypothetical protein